MKGWDLQMMGNLHFELTALTTLTLSQEIMFDALQVTMFLLTAFSWKLKSFAPKIGLNKKDKSMICFIVFAPRVVLQLK